MNIERLEQMAQWLEDGAPHVVFNMEYGGTQIGKFIDYEESDVDYPDVVLERDAKGLGDCGSICCIAGYAVAQYKGNRYLQKLNGHWEAISRLALDILDLPSGQTTGDPYMGHDLFDPNLAPHDCTPQQAAQAVRNVIAGKEPWEGVK